VVIHTGAEAPVIIQTPQSGIGGAGQARPKETAEAIQEKTDETVPGEIAKVRVETPADLFGYLSHLTKFLPEKMQEEFFASDIRLRLESIRTKLLGKRGLLDRAVVRYGTRPSQPLKKRKAKKEHVGNLLSFLQSLSVHHPDRSLALAMKYKITYILQQLKGAVQNGSASPSDDHQELHREDAQSARDGDENTGDLQ
jgi:hypothetical protein